MTGSGKDDALSIRDAPTSSRSRRRRALIAGCSLLLVLISMATLLWFVAQERQLNKKEQQLLGVWEMQNLPGGTSTVIYFDERGRMTVSSPPFTTFHFAWWHIDQNDRLHSRHKGLIEKILSINQTPLDCAVRSSNGRVILTTENGAEHVLTRYAGAGLQKMKDAR